MIKLYDVVDIRDGRYYSVVIIKKNKAKWFIPYVEEEETDDTEE